MNTRTLTKRPTVQLPTLPRLLLLALFFLAGVLLGQVLSGRVPDTTGDELRRYLEDYVRLGGEGAPTVQTALSALVIYFRYPLFAFLLGFASIGVVLLPCVTAAYGFFLSFSVCCFTAAFGGDWRPCPLGEDGGLPLWSTAGPAGSGSAPAVWRCWRVCVRSCFCPRCCCG